MDDGRCFNLSRVAGLNALGLQALGFLARLVRLTLGTPSSAGASALEPRLRHPHHLFGDAVCFLLVDVAGSIYREFCWYPGEIMTQATICGRIGDGRKAIRFSLQKTLHGLISIRAL